MSPGAVSGGVAIETVELEGAAVLLGCDFLDVDTDFVGVLEHAVNTMAAQRIAITAPARERE